jgi:hypothetical protein
MADYYAQTVVEQVIPNADMTPLERLVLTHVFDFEEDGNGLYLFAEECPRERLSIPATTLKAAHAASAGVGSRLRRRIARAMAAVKSKRAEVEIDLTAGSYEFILQDIVRRSRTLRYVSVVGSFTCSKMRSDGFGGMATFITAGAVKGMSTYQFIEDCIANFERKKSTPPAKA